MTWLECIFSIFIAIMLSSTHTHTMTMDEWSKCLLKSFVSSPSLFWHYCLGGVTIKLEIVPHTHDVGIVVRLSHYTIAMTSHHSCLLIRMNAAQHLHYTYTISKVDMFARIENWKLELQILGTTKCRQSIWTAAKMRRMSSSVKVQRSFHSSPVKRFGDAVRQHTKLVFFVWGRTNTTIILLVGYSMLNSWNEFYGKMSDCRSLWFSFQLKMNINVFIFVSVLQFLIHIIMNLIEFEFLIYSKWIECYGWVWGMDCVKSSSTWRYQWLIFLSLLQFPLSNWHPVFSHQAHSNDERCMIIFFLSSVRHLQFIRIILNWPSDWTETKLKSSQRLSY